jgi:tetratricopeptide (TPR) repeat protein
LADALSALGVVLGRLGELEEAEGLLVEAVDVYVELGDGKGVASSRCNLGAVRGGLGDLEGAEGLLTEALDMNQAHEDDYGIAVSLNNLGIVFWGKGDLTEAEAHLEKGLSLVGDHTPSMESLGKELATSVLDNLARVRFCSNGFMDDLLRRLPGGYSLEDIDILRGWMSMLEGHSLASQGRWEEAWELVEAGERVIEGLGDLRPSRFAWQGVRLVGDRGG